MSNRSGRPGLVEIKICGITNPSDAMDSIGCGADALGFNLFSGSKRYIDIDKEAEWIAGLPGHIGKVAVLVNSPIDAALRIAALPFIDSLQLHGQETEEYCRALSQSGVSFTKAIPIRDESSLLQPHHFS